MGKVILTLLICQIAAEVLKYTAYVYNQKLETCDMSPQQKLRYMRTVETAILFKAILRIGSIVYAVLQTAICFVQLAIE